MADNKKKNTRPTQEEIVKGKIANALTSAAKNHIVATTDDLYDTDFQMYQDEINKLIFTGLTNEYTIHFYKKQEGSEETTWITDVFVTNDNTLLKYPELDYSEFVNGGYWDTNIATLRQLTEDAAVYYITPFMTSKDNETLLKICYNNGWSSSPGHLTINEAESITDEMVAEASKKLSLIEDEQGNLIEVFDSIIFVEEGEDPIVMTNYNLYDGLCYDKNGNEYNIKDCCCYSKDGKRHSLDEVKYGNCFYELESWTELPNFTGITKLSDGETYRVFLDYSRIREINLENITSLPKDTLFRCVHLENLYIPSGLTDIETYAIASCDGLQSLVVDENNPKYTSRDSNSNECNCIVEKPVATRGRRSAVNNQLTLIQGCNVTTLPDNIKHIASGAFDECTRLTSITLPDGLLTIGDNVFRGCTALSGNIIVPNTVESIGESTFRNCIALQGININIPVISSYLFKDCSSLSSVTLGNNVTEIGNQAFMNDSSLTAITIPDGVTEIGTSAFANCDLRSINTNNIEIIKANAFANNYNLSSVTMTDATVIIRDGAFASTSISAITIPQNVKNIGVRAFGECNNLQRVVWDVNDVSLVGYEGKFAVFNAGTITNFEFGEHCTVIPNELCLRLHRLNNLNIPSGINTIGANAFTLCTSITSVNIPDSVEHLYYGIFIGCSALRTAVIGSGVTVLPQSMFAQCSSLETLDLSNSPRKIDLAVANVFQDCTSLSLIIVPDNLITDYRESEDWYEYREIIFGNSIYTITFDSMGGETTPSTQNVRCGGYIQDPGSVHKDLYEFEYWEDEDGNEWDFEEDYAVGDVTLYAHYSEVKAIMVKSISNDVTNISMSYYGSYPANVEYSYDGLNWNSMDYNTLNISTNGDYNNYVYFRGYNPDGFSRDWNNYTRFNINNGQCDLLGNLMYLKDYNNTVNSIGYCEFLYCFQNCYALRNCDKLTLFTSATTLSDYCYRSMFEYCTGLTTAPELPATTSTNQCYYYMFYGCSSLNYIKCLAINGINQNSSTFNWVNGVQTNSGTFVKHPDATSWTTGINGMPNNWTVEDAVIE